MLTHSVPYSRVENCTVECLAKRSTRYSSYDNIWGDSDPGQMVKQQTFDGCENGFQDGEGQKVSRWPNSNKDRSSLLLEMVGGGWHKGRRIY
jgi:hypothetical protein